MRKIWSKKARIVKGIASLIEMTFIYNECKNKKHQSGDLIEKKSNITITETQLNKLTLNFVCARKF